MAVNKVILIGNLGADPEIRQTSGGPVCNLRIATTEKWKDREGNPKEETEWHSVTVWGRQAESCGRFLSKGRQVYVEGRLKSRVYQDKDGNDRKVWDVVAQSVQFLAGGAQGGGNGGQQRGNQSGGGWGQSGQSQGQGQGGGWGQKQVDQQASGGGGWGQEKSGGDDPIPF